MQIQDLIVDVLYDKKVRIGDASGEVPKLHRKSKKRDMRDPGASLKLQRPNVIRTGSNAHCTFCMPVAEYQALISLCDRSTPEYKKFSSGIIMDQAVHFLFDESTAQSLYQYALARCPAAAKHIQQTMREPGDEFPF